MKVTTADKETSEAGLGHGEKLTRRQDAAIVALLAHSTIPESAKAAGVGETTLWRWLQREEFRKKYREAQDKVFEGALGSLQGASTEAVDCLKRNLTNGTASAEVQAAKIILEYTLKARELFGMETRIAQLEAALKATQSNEQRKKFRQILRWRKVHHPG